MFEELNMKPTKFSKTPKVDDSVISSTQFLTSMSNNPAPIVAGICHRYKITPKFIEEFRNYITPNMFMESPRLSIEMTEMYPDLFDYNKFIEGVKLANSKPEEEEEDDLSTTPAAPEEETEEKQEEETDPFPEINMDKLSLSMIVKLRGEPDVVDLISDKMVIDAIYDTDPNELNNEDLALSVMGISSEIDNVLLRSIKDQEVKDAILLTLSVSDDSNITSTTYRYYSNDMKESILGTEDVDPKEFVRALAESKDLGWKERMVNDAINKTLQLRKTTDNFEKDVIQFFALIPEKLIAKFLTLREYMPNTISYKVMVWVMENKDFSEDDYITALAAFRSAGLFFNLKKLAKQNDYRKLEEAMNGNK